MNYITTVVLVVIFTLDSYRTYGVEVKIRAGLLRIPDLPVEMSKT
jgi:hypothetical protein